MMSSRARSKSARRHNPLAEDLVATGNLRVKSNKRKAKTEEHGDRFVDSRSSRKILKIGQDLIDEDQKENAPISSPNMAFTFESRFPTEAEADEDAAAEDEDAWGYEEEEVVEEIVCRNRQGTNDTALTMAAGRK